MVAQARTVRETSETSDTKLGSDRERILLKPSSTIVRKFNQAVRSSDTRLRASGSRDTPRAAVTRIAIRGLPDNGAVLIKQRITREASGTSVTQLRSYNERLINKAERRKPETETGLFTVSPQDLAGPCENCPVDGMTHRTVNRCYVRAMSTIRDIRDSFETARFSSLSRPRSNVTVAPSAKINLHHGQLRERCLSSGPFEGAVGMTDPPFATP